jgi:adenylate cyclase
MAEARVERRLAAILAADVAGYSRLMGADEVGTLAALKDLRREVVDPAIAHHRGRIVKTTGDGMLVEFASAVDAVTCAVEIQEKMAERAAEGSGPLIQFRVGINIGDIIIEGDDIFGDGVNVAARVENECEPGRVYLSGSAFEQVRGKTSFAFDDLGERSLKNIDRAVRLYAPRSAVSSKAIGTRSQAEAAKLLPLPDKPSVAVLPFQNMSGDPEQEYFADGMVEDIITALTHFKSLFVIARNSSFTYKGKAVDIKQVGRELGVRYVVEGSVRKAGGRVRITGQLIEAATGAHLWADKIDGALEDVFELQDEVTLRIAGAIEPSITQAEINRAQVKPTSNLDAYDLYLRAVSVHYSQTRSDLDEALRLLEQAIALDTGYSLAKAFASSIHVVKVSQGWASSEGIARAVQLAREALNSGRDEPKTITFAALCLAWLAHDYDIAVAAVDRAVHLNPNSFDVLMRSGAVRNLAGDFDRAIDHFLRSIRSSPLDPQLGWAHGGLAYAYIAKGDYEKAVAYARRGAHEMPQWTTGWIWLAIACAHLGDLEAAREAVRRVLQLRPNFSVSIARTTRPPRREQWLNDRMEHGLRLAGVPEE